MFKRINQAFIKVSNDRTYNILLAILSITMVLSILTSSTILFISATLISLVEIFLIFKAYRELKNENK